MNILIAVPGISYETALQSSVIGSAGDLVDMNKFSPSLNTLDVFPKEMEGLKLLNFWSIGIPHWPMEANQTSGVAGPGVPVEELFFPPSAAPDMVELCGSYDKWRPYPVESAPISKYALKIASRFATKRGKLFEHIVKFCPWETIFWVEHAPASLGHVDQKAALTIADRVLSKALRVARSRPKATFVFFSPYGVGTDPGFVVSNGLEPGRISDWPSMRQYLLGKLDLYP